jgi:hypothetical protein
VMCSSVDCRIEFRCDVFQAPFDLEEAMNWLLEALR